VAFYSRAQIKWNRDIKLKIVFFINGHSPQGRIPGVLSNEVGT
jgi:hypothetical protein